jgi:protein-arginine kinase activator protein McsA
MGKVESTAYICDICGEYFETSSKTQPSGWFEVIIKELRPIVTDTRGKGKYDKELLLCENCLNSLKNFIEEKRLSLVEKVETKRRGLHSLRADGA